MIVWRVFPMVFSKRPAGLSKQLIKITILWKFSFVRLVFRGAESYTYIYLYENFHLIELPWNYTSTWCLTALGVDFCYYWLHRACHGEFQQSSHPHPIIQNPKPGFSEVHILWAQHQVHHSSEEFNLPVGLRQSILQGWCAFVSAIFTFAERL